MVRNTPKTHSRLAPHGDRFAPQGGGGTGRRQGHHRHTTDRMRQHYSSVGNDETKSIGERVVSPVPSVSRG